MATKTNVVSQRVEDFDIDSPNLFNLSEYSHSTCAYHETKTKKGNQKQSSTIQVRPAQFFIHSLRLGDIRGKSRVESHFQKIGKHKHKNNDSSIFPAN